MDKKNTELEQFLTWFSQLEEIPLQTRHDFFAHVVEVGGLDEKAQQFIDNTIDYLDNREQKRLLVLKEKMDLVGIALKIQQKPKLSLKEKIVNGVTSWINNRVSEFKTAVNSFEAQKMQTVEFAEKSREISEVEALKAALI